jgi:hypothetical protein
VAGMWAACSRTPRTRAGGSGAQPNWSTASSVAVSPDGSAVYVAGLFQSRLNKPARFGTIAYSP